MLINRAPLPPTQSVRGSASFLPFWPGSFPSESLNISKFDETPTSELLTIPPGFTSGLVFDSDGVTLLKEDEIESAFRNIPEEKNVINLMELVQKEQDILGTWIKLKKEQKEDSEKIVVEENVEKEEETIIPKEPLVLNISDTDSRCVDTMTEWAVVLDTSKPVKDFYDRIPKMACEFPFELDNFQKLAILHLEQHHHVFVTAHTSAGKTVVAEYAIALSQHHRTKAIYTSPIKALSNQKYRDFQKKFDDVGLMTGDIQINQTASCLIMTTEILRSMLYCGSDVIRDLEYVIFDEVHYINDRERGHVWEQVLILLPPKVCIILLSATVPKPQEFGDWLGRIRQKRVYVIPTLQRPVPLQHFLYTGTDGKTKKNRFMIMNADNWYTEGYFTAKNSMPDQSNKKSYDRRQFNEKQDKTLWVALISHLETEKLLPVVVFTFSRAKCDRNAANLRCVDLTSASEKAKIRFFYNECIKHLKEADKELPQVKMMGELLVRGIGVHHSGVLPIIKEIVEMLFQSELIKLLFATETFAMGVNMPARTVIFDSIMKHDGQEWRNLEPAEYIQMAGRAGRRGLDKKGTVLILCKNQLPAENTLKEMMKGRPQTLKSQFRLTYGMVLSLLRAETLSVKDVMARSFLEVDNQKKTDKMRKELEDVNKEISSFDTLELSNYLQPLVAYFDSANKYFTYCKEIIVDVFSHGKVQKLLVPGRILLIAHKCTIAKLAMVMPAPKGDKQLRVFIITNKSEPTSLIDDKPDLWYKMTSLASNEIYCPTGDIGHEVIDITPTDILEITSHIIKINADFVLRDWKSSQMAQFRNSPPGEATVKAAQELHKLCLASENYDKPIFNHLHLIHDVHVDDSKLYDKLQEMYILKDNVRDNMKSTKIPNFLEQFSTVFSKKYLQERKITLENFLSDDSLILSQYYKNMIVLLKRLKYVNNNNIVQLKGRVACQIGMNELIITELVLQNVLVNLKPAEVAALLSTLVFQGRSRNQEESNDKVLEGLPPTLRKAIGRLQEIHSKLLAQETELDIRSENIKDELNFDIIPIVYEWASQKSFAEIMQYTEYQEGIIVRCIQQLNDTIGDVHDAAKIIGDPALRDKMNEASNAIKRDIVFAASLYTQGVCLPKLKSKT
ncbi:hypothetical protein WA026_013373 [Henosepilachna vigintioctopunctata]